MTIPASEGTPSPATPAPLTPVDQTTFGAPHGNCLMACVASLTGIPLPALDDLYTAEQRTPDRHWWDVFNDALNAHGWHATYHVTEDGTTPDVYAIGSGVSPRGLRHAVVVKSGAVVHDPHPSRDGVSAVEAYYLLAPMEPAHV